MSELPLDDSQLEQWLACQYGETANLAFNEAVVLRLRGTLDAAMLERALETAWQRHAAMRSGFAVDRGVQRLHADLPLPLDRLDLAADGEEAEARFEASCVARERQPFDISRAPLVRLCLARLGQTSHALHANAHRLVMDGWSWPGFMREVAACYSAGIAGREADLPPARPPVAAARAAGTPARDASATLDHTLDYWRRLYAMPPEALRLPADRPPPARPDFGAGTESHAFEPWLLTVLLDIADARGVALPVLLLSALAVLMARLSGQDDLVVGVPLGAATADGAARIGAGASPLPLRLQVDPGLRFEAFVEHVRTALADAAGHRATTLMEILRVLDLRRGVGEPLAGVVFRFEEFPRDIGFDGLEHVLERRPRTASVWDLVFDFHHGDGTLAVDVHFATDRRDATTVRRWIGLYDTLLRNLASGAGGPGTGFDARVGDLGLMDAGQRDQVLEAWNATAMDYDRTQGLPALIEAQMRRTPARVAAEFGQRRIDFAGLEQATRGLAQALGRRGIGRGDMVGVFVPRSLEMLIAVVGVLRSGAAYVPLDPEFPAARQLHMAELARLRHVLATADATLPPEVAAGRDMLDMAQLGAEPVDDTPLPAVQGDDLAYVLFTSGSTGLPKGVRTLHRNIVNLLLSLRREPGFGADDTICAVTTLSFDVAGVELFLPLITGGRMVIASEATRRDPSAMIDLVERGNCTVLQTTPSLLKLVQDMGRAEVVRDLRLFVTGEAMPLSLANSMAGRCREFWNLYGPTETTIYSSLARIAPDIDAVPLGHPLANTRIYVLDPRGQPVPPGVIGEIWIGGDGVADGYLFRPDLTAGRFVDDPFAGGGAAMYRTGDLGSWHDGELRFHGRVDHQMKIRGCRIEPGDIEAAAATDPAVQGCLVVAHNFGDNDLRLVLYAATDEPGADLAARLRRRLRESLPPYMVPQHIELLEALPKMPNGKIDRKALPAPATVAAGHAPDAPAGAEPPLSDPRQAYVAATWRDMIGVQRIRADDNFLDLGGHSLLAVEFVVRMQRETGVRLQPMDVLKGTLASLAASLPEDPGTGAPSSMGARLRALFGGG